MTYSMNNIEHRERIFIIEIRARFCGPVYDEGEFSVWKSKGPDVAGVKSDDRMVCQAGRFRLEGLEIPCQHEGRGIQAQYFIGPGETL